jgi:hypothetical protein
MDSWSGFAQSTQSVNELIRELNGGTAYSVIPSLSCKPGETFYHDEQYHRFITCSIYNDYDWPYRWDDIIAEEKAHAKNYLQFLVRKTRIELRLPLK